MCEVAWTRGGRITESLILTSALNSVLEEAVGFTLFTFSGIFRGGAIVRPPLWSVHEFLDNYCTVLHCFCKLHFAIEL